jgi:hypothetical protein
MEDERWLSCILAGPNPSRADAFRGKLLELAALDLDVREETPNDAPAIRLWLARRGIVSPAAYCAAWISAKIEDAAQALGLDPPLRPSAGALRLAYHAADAFVRQDRSGVGFTRMRPGDVLVWKRPGASWTGHVGIVTGCDGVRTFTMEANVAGDVDDTRQGVHRKTHRLLDDALWIGFVDWDLVPAFADEEGATAT